MDPGSACFFALELSQPDGFRASVGPQELADFAEEVLKYAGSIILPLCCTPFGSRGSWLLLLLFLLLYSSDSDHDFDDDDCCCSYGDIEDYDYHHHCWHHHDTTTTTPLLRLLLPCCLSNFGSPTPQAHKPGPSKRSPAGKRRPRFCCWPRWVSHPERGTSTERNCPNKPRHATGSRAAKK